MELQVEVRSTIRKMHLHFRKYKKSTCNVKPHRRSAFLNSPADILYSLFPLGGAATYERQLKGQLLTGFNDSDFEHVTYAPQLRHPMHKVIAVDNAVNTVS